LRAQILADRFEASRRVRFVVADDAFVAGFASGE
jgi:hypothetical protein